MDFDKIFKIIESMLFIIFIGAVIGYYYADDEAFYRLIMEYAGLAGLFIWPGIRLITKMIIKAHKKN